MVDVVIDVLGAPANSGGMRVYAEEVVRAWAERFPLDRIHVVGYPWARGAFEDLGQVHVHVVKEGTVGRTYGQLVHSAFVARKYRVDALVSASMLTTPFFRADRRFCVAHDWRHKRYPDEFGLAQRAYRWLWVWSTRRARLVVQISAKTDRETARYSPRATRRIIENGRDHPRRWAIAERAPTRQDVLTFGHHTNKRADLVMRAFAAAAVSPGHPKRSRLVILGVRGVNAQSLDQLARELGLYEQVDFPGYVEAAEYQRLVQQAGLIVLASTDEGFGLPVVEGNFFGVPVVGTDDGGLAEIHGDRVVTVPATVESLASAISTALQRRQAQIERPGPTWGDHACALRQAVVDSLS